MTEKKTNFVFEIIKWLIGTVGLGLTTVIVNNRIQERELEIKRLDADANFLKVVTQDVSRRTDSSELSYLKFVHTFITTEDIQKEIKLRIAELGSHIDETGISQANKSSSLKAIQIENSLNEDQKQEFRNLAKRDSTDKEQKSLEKLFEKESSIATNITPIDSASVKMIADTKKFTTPITVTKEKQRYTLVGSPITKWCKEGYYVEFNNSLRLGVNNLTKRTIYFNLKDVEGEKSQNPSIIKNNTNVSLSEGENYTVEYENYRYDISLDYIGSAGKNPFTKAGYLTVKTYRKTANKR